MDWKSWARAFSQQLSITESSQVTLSPWTSLIPNLVNSWVEVIAAPDVNIPAYQVNYVTRQISFQGAVKKTTAIAQNEVIFDIPLALAPPVCDILFPAVANLSTVTRFIRAVPGGEIQWSSAGEGSCTSLRLNTLTWNIP